jgi:hypothetical protein
MTSKPRRCSILLLLNQGDKISAERTCTRNVSPTGMCGRTIEKNSTTITTIKQPTHRTAATANYLSVSIRNQSSNTKFCDIGGYRRDISGDDRRRSLRRAKIQCCQLTSRYSEVTQDMVIHLNVNRSRGQVHFFNTPTMSKGKVDTRALIYH